MAKKKGKVNVNIKVSGMDNFFEKMKKMSAEDKKNNYNYCCNSKGIGFWGFGSALAMILSYAQNSSILWAIIHGVISWFYVLYRVMVNYGWINAF